MEGYRPADNPPDGRTPADVWIAARAAETAAEATKALEEFAFDRYAGAMERFFWNEFCDVYIELAKPALKDPGRREAVLWTLRHVLDLSMRLLHPVVPFISEEIWQRIPRATGDGKLLIRDPWPQPAPPKPDQERQAAPIRDFVIPVAEAIRSLKHEQGRTPRQEAVVFILPNEGVRTGWRDADAAYIKILCGAELRPIGRKAEAPRYNISTVISGLTLFLELPAPADPGAERARLTKERAELAQLRDRRNAELANSSYVAKAPAELVEETRLKVADYSARIARLEERLKQLS
jgi:valyl-tRNA synthetase